MTVDAEEIVFANLLDVVSRTFRHEAEARKLSFDVHVDQNLGRSIVTDSKRLQQVLKNLLSNAFKFTEHGGVRLIVSAVSAGWSSGHPVLNSAGTVVAFEVSDTGIGIPPEKQRIIFEAFQQADASTSRRYGGTGLGLAISRELANLLGGEIQLRSVPGTGSTFTLYLPLKYVGSTGFDRSIEGEEGPRRRGDGSFPAVHIADRPITQIPDDREDLAPGDAVMLIVEDDPHYARIMMDLARDKGFKVLVAMRGADALALTRQYKPTAVSLDVFLPDMLGWTVLSHLKKDPEARHIPVQIVTLEEDRQHGLSRGAFAFVTKPTTTEGLEQALARIKAFSEPRRKRLAGDRGRLGGAARRFASCSATTTSTSRSRAPEPPRSRRCASSFRTARCWICVSPTCRASRSWSGCATTRSCAICRWWCSRARSCRPRRRSSSRTMARSVVVKGVESPERLLDETALFLHRVVSDLPPEKQAMLQRLHGSDEDLVGRQVLVVDDDVRNIFALSSVLERRGMQVLTATTGREAIELLESKPDVAIALMDIMMPEMDGYQTIQIIRQNPSFRRLPIIALTAKAMKGDREKCLEAGASDYLAKPVNTEQLLSALRLWLHR